MAGRQAQAVRQGAEETKVMARSSRRRFTAEYEASIVQQVAQCRAPGEIGALLRREGLFSSQLTMWRKLYQRGATHALSQVRGPTTRRTAETATVARLERENAQLRDELAGAELVIEMQRNSRRCWGCPQTRRAPSARDHDARHPRGAHRRCAPQRRVGDSTRHNIAVASPAGAHRAAAARAIVTRVTGSDPNPSPRQSARHAVL
jgi:transposase